MPELTRAEIETALKHAKGNKAEAARYLDVAESTLKDRLRREGIAYTPPETIEEICEKEGIPLDDVSHYWFKTDEASIFVRRPHAEQDFESIADRLCERMAEHVPDYTPPSYTPGECALVVDLADVHIGKLCLPAETGESYDISEAQRRVVAGMEGLLAKAAPHGIEAIVLPIGNDILHIDHPHRTTTAGTPQDTDGQWWSMFDAAQEVMVRVIERAASVAPVHLVFVPSNHDYASGYYLARTLQAWFRNHPSVTCDPVSMSIRHRKYLTYGRNLLGFTHGDGAKEKDLPLLMATEAGVAWGETTHRFMHCHHLHHKIRKWFGPAAQQTEKDHIGVTVLNSSVLVDPAQNVSVEYVRSPSSTDSWHHRNGFCGVPQAVEAFLYDVRGGQPGRFTHEF